MEMDRPPANFQQARKGDGEENGRNRHVHFREPHQKKVQFAAVKPGHQAHCHSNDRRREHGRDSDRQRNARAINNPREHVPAQIICAEQISAIGGTRQPIFIQPLFILLVRGTQNLPAGQRRRGQSEQSESEDDQSADSGKAVVQQRPHGRSEKTKVRWHSSRK